MLPLLLPLAHAAIVDATLLALEGDTPAGFSSAILALDAPGSTRDGTPFFSGSLLDGTDFLALGATVLWSAPQGDGFILSSAVASPTSWAFVRTTGSSSELVLPTGVALTSGQPLPALPFGATLASLGEVAITDDGVVVVHAWVTGVVPGQPVTALLRLVDGHTGVLHTTGGPLAGATLLDVPDGSWDLARGGATALIGDLSTEWGVVVVDDAVVLAPGDPTGTGTHWGAFLDDVAHDSRGLWIATGDVSLPYQPAAIATPFETLVLGNTTLAGVALDPYDEVGAVGLDEQGRAAFLWTDLLGEVATAFVACDAADLAGSARAVVSAGDGLDFDADGTADLWVLALSDRTARPHDLLTGRGDLLLHVEVGAYPTSFSTDDALIRVDPGCTCAGSDADLGAAVGMNLASGDTCGAGDDHPTVVGTCAAAGADLAWSWTAPADGDYTFAVQGTGAFRPTLRLHTDTCVPVALDCLAPGTGGAQVTRAVRKGERLRLIADAPAGGCGPVAVHIQGCPGDHDADGVCDPDACLGDDALGDADADGLCLDLDACAGDDATGDPDGDRRCTDQDDCWGDDRTGDDDLDLTCNDLDLCWGLDATGDDDADGFCDSDDLCAGDDAWGDADADGLCDDTDFTLDVTRVVPGQPMTVRAFHAPPGAAVRFYATLSGHGAAPCAGAVCGGLAAPVTIATRTGSASGFAQATLPVPALPAGRVLLFQATWTAPGAGDVTEVVSRVSRAP